MDCGGKRSATPLFEPEGSSLKLVASSWVRKRRGASLPTAVQDGSGRFEPPGHFVFSPIFVNQPHPHLIRFHQWFISVSRFTSSRASIHSPDGS